MSRKSTSKSKKDYVNPEKLYYAVLECKQKNTLTKECYSYFQKMITKILNMNKYPLQDDYDDCFATAMSYCWTSIKAFDPNITTNAFSFFTQTIKNAITLSWNKLYPKKYKNTICFVGNTETGTGLYSL